VTLTAINFVPVKSLYILAHGGGGRGNSTT